MHKYQKLFTIIIFLSFFQMKAVEPGDSIAWEGVNAFYNNETARAVDILTEAREEFPLNAAVHFTWATARWLHSQANDPIEKTYEVLNRDLDEIIPLYEYLAENYPDNPLYRLYLGSAEGLRARVYLGQKRWLKTLIPAYLGFKITKDVADNYPEIKDAMLPIGVVEYYAALRSSILKWAASLFGLETTKEAGLAKMEIAANCGDFAWIEARSLLSFIYLWEAPDIVKALEHSKILAEKFPKNFYFVLMYAESLIKTEDYGQANAVLLKLNKDFMDLTPTQKFQMKSYLDYEWALYWFEQDQYNKALTFTENSIKDYQAELDIYLTNSLLLLGNIQDVIGNRSTAKIAYQKCIKLDNNSDAVHLAKIYIDEPYKK
ncbi:tol-pal system YbgF family protein [Candidatus Neomarinimicrobiota bacterium]